MWRETGDRRRRGGKDVLTPNILIAHPPSLRCWAAHHYGEEVARSRPHESPKLSPRLNVKWKDWQGPRQNECLHERRRRSDRAKEGRKKGRTRTPGAKHVKRRRRRTTCRFTKAKKIPSSMDGAPSVVGDVILTN